MKQRLEALLRRLWLFVVAAKDRTFVIGQSFEVEHLSPKRFEGVQENGFSSSRQAIDHLEGENRRAFFDDLENVLAIGFVAAVDQPNAPADFGQDRGQAARALSAAEAVNERVIAPWLIGKKSAQMRGDVF